MNFLPDSLFYTSCDIRDFLIFMFQQVGLFLLKHNSSASLLGPKDSWSTKNRKGVELESSSGTHAGDCFSLLLGNFKHRGIPWSGGYLPDGKLRNWTSRIASASNQCLTLQRHQGLLIILSQFAYISISLIERHIDMYGRLNSVISKLLSALAFYYFSCWNPVKAQRN